MKTLDAAIKKLFVKVRDEGEVVTVHRTGMENAEFKELRNVHFTIDGDKALHSFLSLRPLLLFTVSDIVDQMLQHNPPTLVERYLKHDWTKYKDTLGFHTYTYGNRMMYQVSDAIAKLKKDPNSRQVLISLWDPCRDSNVNSWHIPCTLYHQLFKRNNRLHMIVNYRSHDMFGGFQHDMYFSSFFLQFYASALNCEVGDLHCISNSFHTYKKDYEQLEKLIREIDMLKSGHQKHIYNMYKPLTLQYNNPEVTISEINYLSDYSEDPLVSVLDQFQPLLRQFAKVFYNRAGGKISYDNEFQYYNYDNKARRLVE